MVTEDIEQLNANRNTVCAIVSIELPHIFRIMFYECGHRKFKNGHGW